MCKEAMASVEMLNTLALFHYYTRLAKTIDQIIKTSLKEPMYVCRASHSGLLLLVLERLRSVSMATPLLLIPFLTFTSRTQPPLSESLLRGNDPPALCETRSINLTGGYSRRRDKETEKKHGAHPISGVKGSHPPVLFLHPLQL